MKEFSKFWTKGDWKGVEHVIGYRLTFDALTKTEKNALWRAG